ncbi:endopeptidase La [Microvenator marinus]|uniref:Lon protease n=1 Tax=Microvenator marinus TaxID=2600177 RepID=A0A5B8XV84_9DELT|nr:endopeptidase La [Microvenator marinus]QED27646.1 endopeptidase La [Microvenator marinus]
MSRRIPLLPLRDIIVFPNMVLPLFVGRERSIKALEAAMAQDKEVVLSAQKKAKTNEPSADDIFRVGTVGIIDQLFQLPDGTVKVLVRGKQRVKIEGYQENDAYFEVEITPIQDFIDPAKDVAALMKQLRETFEAYVALNKRIPPEMLSLVAKIEEKAEDPARLGDTIVAQLALKLRDKQEILENEDVLQRLEKLDTILKEEIDILQVERKIRTRVKKQMEKSQKDFYDNPQNKEMGGDPNEFKNEIDELEEKISQKAMSDEAHDKLSRELKKLKMMSPMSAEATVVRNYIDWVISLPWDEVTEERLDVAEAHQTLEDDHYGLDKPKERILEYLSVQSLVTEHKGPILCLVGPPGVGKTSLGRSIATATNRNFIRLSLGGVRDEAEIRGHRRTYIGAMPGKIVQSLRKAGSNNPVFLLDEIDKMSTDFRGDPSSALLEVLDPEQNSTFNDHYLDLDYDLSKVMFICTANSLQQIPGPLLDRMEVIQIPGYTDFEKLEISKRYLIPKQRKNNGIEDVEVSFAQGAIGRIIGQYTREAGVRSLEREIGTVCRKIARQVVENGKEQEFEVDARSIPKYLGPPRFKHDTIEEEDQVGITNGVAWTQYGGVMLISEASVIPGKGKFIITGKLGDVMQESAQAAMTYVRSRAMNLGLSPDFHQKVDIHVHFPEGALPKDGPSAGITMVTSIVSALTQIPVRHNVAMTGEITLRGRVLPIGGLKEKGLAAHRGGVKTLIIPKDNAKDIREIPKAVRKAMTIIAVDHMDEVLQHALAIENPEVFRARLEKPLLPPDVSIDHVVAGQPVLDDSKVH